MYLQNTAVLAVSLSKQATKLFKDTQGPPQALQKRCITTYGTFLTSRTGPRGKSPALVAEQRRPLWRTIDHYLDSNQPVQSTYCFTLLSFIGKLFARGYQISPLRTVDGNGSVLRTGQWTFVLSFRRTLIHSHNYNHSAELCPSFMCLQPWRFSSWFNFCRQANDWTTKSYSLFGPWPVAWLTSFSKGFQTNKQKRNALRQWMKSKKITYCTYRVKILSGTFKIL
jgi:hypothetical protein